jgi:hypothetical protein
LSARGDGSGVGLPLIVGEAAAAGVIGEMPVRLDGRALVSGRLKGLSSTVVTLSLGGTIMLKKKLKAGNLMV